MVVTNLRSRFDGSRWSLPWDPVATLHAEFSAIEHRFVADDDAVALRIEFHDVKRLRRRDAQSLSLANGVKLNAVVLPEHAPVNVHDVALMLLHEIRLLEKLPVVLVGHETDFHALLLVGGLELTIARDLARVTLRQFAEREHRAGKLLLFQ